MKNIPPPLDINTFAYLQDLQWSCHSEKTFVVVFHLLEKKYIVERKNSVKEAEALVNFFDYFREQWGPGSPVFRWYEGAYPWSVSHNQGIEGLNKSIKKDHTFKRRCPLGTFMNLINRMVKSFNKVLVLILFRFR